jgi:parallel beta-helix repeat protein
MLAALHLLSAAPAKATVYYLRADGTGDIATIREALDIVVNGDVIELADGTYRGWGSWGLEFHGKAITLRSGSGNPEDCIIDCEASERALIFWAFEGPDSRVEGITIRNGQVTYGGAIYCSYSSPTITNCILTENVATLNGGAVFIQHASPVIEDCVITENSSYFSGGGIRCERSASPTIRNCTISGNEAGYDGGGVSCYEYSSPLITGCTITANTAVFSAGGVQGNYHCDVELVDCVVVGNAAGAYGGGCSFVTDSEPVVEGSTISGNRATSYGGGIYLQGSQPEVERSILWGNCSNDGPELYTADATSDIQFLCCVVDSSAFFGPGEVDFSPGSVFTDPLFCAGWPCASAPSGWGDYTLDGASPCIAENNSCGVQIGALGFGCGVDALSPASWGAVKARYR